MALLAREEEGRILLGAGRSQTGQTCRARYQGPDLPKLMLVPPSPAWESSYTE